MNKMKCFLSKKMLLAVVVLLSVGYVQAQEAKDHRATDCLTKHWKLH